jgi:hypothetical protein
MLALSREAGNPVCARRGKERLHARRHEADLNKYAAQRVVVLTALKDETRIVESVGDRVVINAGKKAGKLEAHLVKIGMAMDGMKHE